MYPESGPSRSQAPYPIKGAGGPGNGSGPGPSSRAGSSRWDGEYEGARDRDDRGVNGYAKPGESSGTRPYSAAGWQNRPPRQGGPSSRAGPGPLSNSAPGSRPRSHSPSPPRRGYDRDRDRGSYDVRDRLSLETGVGGPDGSGPRRTSGFVGPPAGWDREWTRDDRRWGDRRDDRDRFREDPRGPPPARPVTSGPNQTPRFASDRIPPPRSPPSGPRIRPLPPAKDPSYPSPARGGLNGRGPNRYPFSTPRREDERGGQFTPRDGSRPFDRPGNSVGPGPGPSSLSYAASQPSRPTSPSSTPAPRAPRSMRGSSSPVDTRRAREYEESQITPQAAFAAEGRMAGEEPEEGEDLEEGEVLSPVQPARAPSWSYTTDERDRPGRRGYSPPPRDRDRWERERDRERDMDRDRERNLPRRRTPPSPHWASRRPLDEYWTPGPNPNGHALGPRVRRRSNSIPPRWREDEARSPRRVIPHREEGELGPIDKEDDEVIADDPDAGTEAGDVKEEPMEDGAGGATHRPRTPDGPPPLLDRLAPRSESPAAVEMVQADPEDEERVVLLSSRPETPHLPLETGTIDAVQREQSSGDQDSTQPGGNIMDQPMSSPPQTKVHDSPDLQRSIPVGIDAPEAVASKAIKPEIGVDQAAPASRINPQAEVETKDAVEVAVPFADTDRLMLLESEQRPAQEAQSAKGTADMNVATAETSLDTVETPAESAVQSPSVIVVPEADIAGRPSTARKSSADKVKSRGRIRTPLNNSNDNSSDTPSSPPARRVTIAERRSMVLPPTSKPITSSPFGEKTPRRDPMPTNYSTDAETDGGPKTADIVDDAKSFVGDDVLVLEDITEETRQSVLISAIKAAQAVDVDYDHSSIVAWNVAAAPEPSSRTVELSGDEHDVTVKCCFPLPTRQERAVAQLVALTIAHEASHADATSEALKAEYLSLDEEWRDHCEFLDALMEKRGPPPPDLYAVPGTIIPVVTPGPVAPTTPLPEEVFNARGNRRRGAGDAVTTEAEFEAILAGLADTAAKDPTYRANKTSAVVPDMLPRPERKLRYDDDNDLITDPLAFYDYQGNAEPIWTPEERTIFVRRYMAYPKQFGRIADGISNKSASDCVLYYYRTKKEVDYKGMLASKRGGGKKKSIPIKKGGKGSALLADLEKKKPTMASTDGANTPVRGARDRDRDREDSVIPGTSAKKTKSTNSADTGSGGGARRRRTTLNIVAAMVEANTHTRTTAEDIARMESEANSRAGSETPGGLGQAQRAKMRMTVKTVKRPRVSSMSESMRAAAPVTPGATTADVSPTVVSSAPVDPTVLPIDAATTVAATPPAGMDPAVAQTELLPPVKRAGKRRKVLADPAADANADPSAAAVQSANGAVAGTPSAPGAPGQSTPAEKPTRRSATNSYWSVDEKKKVKELVAIHGIDIKAIASQLKGKSERQVGNFLEGHRAELLDNTAGNGGAIKSEDDKRSVLAGGSTGATPGDTFRSAIPTRTIYDAFPTSFAGSDRYEPRLGMFPPSPPAGSAGQAPSVENPPLKPVSRSGGMRISALLNDDRPAASKERERPLTGNSTSDTVDAASDGTVDDRDMDGMIRPSPRSAPPVVNTPSSQGYQGYPAGQSQHRPDLDRYRSSASVPATSQTFAPTPANWAPTPAGVSPAPRPAADVYHRDRGRASTTTPVPSTLHHAVPPTVHRTSWPEPGHGHPQAHAHHYPHASAHGNPSPVPPSAQRTGHYPPQAAPGRYESLPPMQQHHHQQYDYPSDRSYPRDAAYPQQRPSHPHGVYSGQPNAESSGAAR
ncbi:hypothetical protein IAU60_004289 [Kwoniella sp. DSM 27419]